MALDIHKDLNIKYEVNRDRPNLKEHMNFAKDFLNNDEHARALIETRVENDLKQNHISEYISLENAVTSHITNILSIFKSLYMEPAVLYPESNFDDFFEENYKKICKELSRLNSKDLMKLYQFSSKNKLTLKSISLINYSLIIHIIEDDEEYNLMCAGKQFPKNFLAVNDWYLGKDSQGRCLWYNYIINNNRNLHFSTYSDLKDSLTENKLREKFDFSDINEILGMEFAHLTRKYNQWSIFDYPEALEVLTGEIFCNQLVLFARNYSVNYSQRVRRDIVTNPDYIRFLFEPFDSNAVNLTLEKLFYQNPEILLREIKKTNSTVNEKISFTKHSVGYKSTSQHREQIQYRNYFYSRIMRKAAEEINFEQLNPIQLVVIIHAISDLSRWAYTEHECEHEALYEALLKGSINFNFIVQAFAYISIATNNNKLVDLSQSSEIAKIDSEIIEWEIELNGIQVNNKADFDIPFLDRYNYEKYIKNSTLPLKKRKL